MKSNNDALHRRCKWANTDVSSVTPLHPNGITRELQSYRSEIENSLLFFSFENESKPIIVSLALQRMFGLKEYEFLGQFLQLLSGKSNYYSKLHYCILNGGQASFRYNESLYLMSVHKGERSVGAIMELKDACNIGLNDLFVAMNNAIFSKIKEGINIQKAQKNILSNYFGNDGVRISLGDDYTAYVLEGSSPIEILSKYKNSMPAKVFYNLKYELQLNEVGLQSKRMNLYLELQEILQELRNIGGNIVECLCSPTLEVMGSECVNWILKAMLMDCSQVTVTVDTFCHIRIRGPVSSNVIKCLVRNRQKFTIENANGTVLILQLYIPLGKDQITPRIKQEDRPSIEDNHLCRISGSSIVPAIEILSKI